MVLSYFNQGKLESHPSNHQYKVVYFYYLIEVDLIWVVSLENNIENKIFINEFGHYNLKILILTEALAANSIKVKTIMFLIVDNKHLKER